MLYLSYTETHTRNDARSIRDHTHAKRKTLIRLDFNNNEMKKNIWNAYKDEAWFPKIGAFLLTKYDLLVAEMVNTFSYVEPIKAHENVWSHKYANVIIESSIVFESVIKEIIVRAKLSYNQDIHAFLKFLKDNDDEIEELQLIFINSEGWHKLIPFRRMNSGDPRPRWWDAYTNLKHGQIGSFPEGNLGNGLNALAAIALLHHKINMVIGRSGFFINVGIIDPDPKPIF